MVVITSAVNWLNGIVWGVPMLVLILGVGLFLTVGLKFLTILRIPFGFKLLWAGRIPGGEGEISPFNALMTSLAGIRPAVNGCMPNVDGGPRSVNEFPGGAKPHTNGS